MPGLKRLVQHWYFDKLKRKLDPDRLANLFRVLTFKLRCQHCGHGNWVDRGVTVVHGQHISIGNDCTIHAGSFLHVAALDKHADQAIVKIGNNCHLGYRTWIAARVGITIGDDVLFGPGVVLQDYNHAYADIATPIHRQPLIDEKPIKIGDGSFLAAGVVVTRGVTIGAGVVIGANSVVTGDIPAHCLAVGSPAKVIKRYNPETGQWDRLK